jgi:disulfide bond formation protein DsbB
MNKLMKIGLVLLIVGIVVGVGAFLYLVHSISSSTRTVTIQPNGTYVFTLHEGQFGAFSYNSTSPISYKVSGNAVVNASTRNGLNVVSIVPQSPTVNVTLYNPSSAVAEVILVEQGFQIVGVLAIALLGFAVFVVGAILAVVGFIRGRRREQ